MEQTIESFVADDYAKVVSAVAVATEHPELADAAVRNAVVKVSTNDKQYEAFAGRVLVVATGEVKILSRKAPTGTEASNAAPLPIHGTLATALGGLHQRQREIALLRYFLGYDNDEIASVTHLNDSTIESHLNAVQTAIADQLQVEADEADPVDAPREASGFELDSEVTTDDVDTDAAEVEDDLADLAGFSAFSAIATTEEASVDADVESDAVEVDEPVDAQPDAELSPDSEDAASEPVDAIQTPTDSDDYWAEFHAQRGRAARTAAEATADSETDDEPIDDTETEDEE